MVKRVSKKFSVEVIYYINPGYDSFFMSLFDSKGMTEEQIIDEVLRRVEAVYTAFKLYDEHKRSHENEEYKEFKREFLA